MNKNWKQHLNLLVLAVILVLFVVFLDRIGLKKDLAIARDYFNALAAILICWLLSAFFVMINGGKKLKKKKEITAVKIEESFSAFCPQ